MSKSKKMEFFNEPKMKEELADKIRREAHTHIAPSEGESLNWLKSFFTFQPLTIGLAAAAVLAVVLFSPFIQKDNSPSTTAGNGLVEMAQVDPLILKNKDMLEVLPLLEIYDALENWDGKEFSTHQHFWPFLFSQILFADAKANDGKWKPVDQGDISEIVLKNRLAYLKTLREQEQKSLKVSFESFKKLPITKQKELKANLKTWVSYKPEVKRVMKKKYEKFKSLNPSKKQALKTKYEKFKRLPLEKQKRILAKYS